MYCITLLLLECPRYQC